LGIYWIGFANLINLSGDGKGCEIKNLN